MTNKILTAFAMLMVLISCDKTEILPEQESLHEMTLRGYMEPQTRTMLEGNTIMWCPGDSIGLFTTNIQNALFKNILEENATDGIFYGQVHIPPTDLWGYTYYPYNSETYFSADTTLHLTLPETQQFVSNTSFGPGANPAVSFGDLRELLNFRNLCGIVKVQLYGDMVVSSIEFIPDNGIVSGKGSVKLKDMDAEPQLVMTDDPANPSQGKVTLKNIHQVQTQQVRSFYIVVPPGSYDGFTIAVNDVNGKRKEHKINKAISVKRSRITTLEPIEVHSYTSYFYYSYATQNSLTAASFGLSASEFEPGAMSQAGNRLYIANRKANAQSIIVYDLESQQVVDIIRSWEYNGQTYTFPNENIDEVYVSEGKLYVANRSSKIEVFDAETLQYITRIGEGVWGETTYRIHHTFAIIQQDSLLFVREKNRLVTYKVSDIKEGSFQRVPAFQRTDRTFYDVNNSYNSYQMIEDKGSLFITNFGGSAENKVLCIDPTLVVKGQESSWVEASRNLSLNFNPVGIAAHSDRFLILQPDGKLNIYDRNKGEVIRTFDSIFGTKFTKPQKLYINGDQMWIVDYGSKEIYNALITTNEIREYSLLTRAGNSNLAQVKDANGNILVVDLLTHEVVESL